MAFAFKKIKHEFASPFRCRSGHKLTRIKICYNCTNIFFDIKKGYYEN